MTRSFIAAVGCAAAVGIFMPVVARAQGTAELQIRTCTLVTGEVVMLDQCLQMLKVKSQRPRSRTVANLQPAAPAAPLGTSVKVAAPSGVNPKKDDYQPVHILLRRSLDDIGSFSKPNDLSDAAGAAFGWARNGSDHNHIWNAQGVIAVPYVREVGKYQGKDVPYLRTLSIAPYIVFDRVNNKDIAAADNVDVLTFGGAGEASIANWGNATHFFTVKGDLVSSFDGGKTKNWAVIGEYHAVGNPSDEGGNTFFSYLGTPLKTGFQSAYWTFTPKLRTEYRGALNGSDDPIFSDRNSAFRSGALLNFGLTVDNLFGQLPADFGGINYQASWGWMRDWVSLREYELFDTVLTVNLNKARNIAVSLSYTRGELTETGKKVDVTKAGLAVKF
jgi:hypothetical protein